MRRVLPFVVAFLCAAPVRAQICVGDPDTRVRPAQISAELDHSDGVTTVGGGLGFSLGGGAFLGANAGAGIYGGSATTATSFIGDVSLGYALPLTGANKAFLCPIMDGSVEVGPNLGTTKLLSFGVGPALAIGGEIPLTPLVSFVPWTAGEFVFAHTRVSTPRDVASGSTTYGIWSIGGSFLLDHRFSLGPTVAIPISVPDGKVAFGFAMTLGLGGP